MFQEREVKMEEVLKKLSPFSVYFKTSFLLPRSPEDLRSLSFSYALFNIFKEGEEGDVEFKINERREILIGRGVILIPYDLVKNALNISISSLRDFTENFPLLLSFDDVRRSLEWLYNLWFEDPYYTFFKECVKRGLTRMTIFGGFFPWGCGILDFDFSRKTSKRILRLLYLAEELNLQDLFSFSVGDHWKLAPEDKITIYVKRSVARKILGKELAEGEILSFSEGKTCLRKFLFKV